MTPDEIAVKIGLKPLAEFCEPIQSFAEAYGCEARGSGRTIRFVLYALAAASEGKRVAFVVCGDANRRRISSLLLDVSIRAEIDALAHGPSSIEIAGGGSVRLVAPLEPFFRCDEVVRDNYDPLTSQPKQRCLHRLAKAKRQCSVCGLKLRRARDLRKARLRQRMMTAWRPIWDHLRISAIDALFKSKDT